MGTNSSTKWRVEGICMVKSCLNFLLVLLHLFCAFFCGGVGGVIAQLWSWVKLFSLWIFPDHISNMMQNYQRGQITNREVGDAVWKNLLQGRLTYLHWNKGEEMTPTTGEQGGTLLVRKIPAADPT